MDVLEALHAHGETGAAIVDLLYGDAGADVAAQLREFAKSDTSQKRASTAASALGIGAGAAAMRGEVTALHEHVKNRATPEAAERAVKATTEAKGAKGFLKPLKRVGAALKTPKGAIGVAAGLTGLQAANIASQGKPLADQMRRRPLAKSDDRRKRAFTAGLSAVGGAAGLAGLGYSGTKMAQAGRVGYKAASGVRGARRVGHAIKAGVKSEKGAAALFPLEVAGLGGEIMSTKILHGDAKKTRVDKSAEIEWFGEIAKADTDKRQVFGWVSVTSIDGIPVQDLQDDEIDLEEIEKAAYDYVRSSRMGGNMHARDGEDPKQVSTLIESFVVSRDKRDKLGLPSSVPDGWWCGFAVDDDDTWNQVKNGELVGFSIHGRGRRA